MQKSDLGQARDLVPGHEVFVMLGLGASQKKQDTWPFMEISYVSVVIKWNSWK